MATPSFTHRRVLGTFALAALTSLAACGSMGSSVSASKPGALAVQPAQSSLSFVSTKAGAAGIGGITELHTFKRYSGGMTASGAIRLSIDLSSVDTGIPIRDERMQTLLWNVKLVPTAEFTAQLPADALAAAAGAGTDVELAGNLSMAGVRKPLAAKLRVARLADGTWAVATRAPIVVNAADFGLRPGVEALREIVGLHFISTAAPVSFNLVLKAQG